MNTFLNFIYTLLKNEGGVVKRMRNAAEFAVTKWKSAQRFAMALAKKAYPAKVIMDTMLKFNWGLKYSFRAMEAVNKVIFLE